MSDVNGGRPRRRYRSPVREEGARRTRQAIVSAAGELFVDRGYVATSLADVAAAAGVARPTVFAAFGSKPALLRHVLDQALAGDDAPVAVADRPWFKPVWDATTPGAVLDAYAEVCLVIARRAAPLFEAVRRAAEHGPEVADLWNTLQSNRRAGAAMIIGHIRTVGDLAPGLANETAIDTLWIFNDPSHYTALVKQRGWSERAYRNWLANRMQDALLPR
ncbi:MAG TPA: TetR/AcrR family transcriptional regulator [Micromonosporaceae bacterium]